MEIARHGLLTIFALLYIGGLYSPTLGASVLKCIFSLSQVSNDGNFASVEQINGLSQLVLPSGIRLSIRQSSQKSLLGPAYHVAMIPYRNFRFDQDKKHMRFASVIEMLKNKAKTTHLAKYGIYNKTDRGILFDDGIYRIQNGHHRSLMLALYGAFLKYGNKSGLSTDDPKFYNALAHWSQEAVLSPLEKFFVPSGPGEYTATDRRNGLMLLQKNLISRLEEIEIPVTVYPKKNGVIEVASKNRTPNVEIENLLLYEDSQTSGITIQPLGETYSKPFDAWMKRHRELYPEFWN